MGIFVCAYLSMFQIIHLGQIIRNVIGEMCVVKDREPRDQLSPRKDVPMFSPPGQCMDDEI